jgi:hypothetical protein
MTLRERAGKLADAFFESADDEAYIDNVEDIEAELNAARNAALEEAAKVAEVSDGATDPNGYVRGSSYVRQAQQIAAAIRALKGSR